MRARLPAACALLLTILLPAVTVAAQSPPTEPAPVLRFIPGTLDFGEILVGGSKSATVEVENASAAPIVISRVIPGCSCTKVSEAPKGTLAPGARFTMTVSLDGGDLGGAKLRKVVNFVIDGHPTELLHLSATVPVVIAVKPEIVDSGRMSEGAPTMVTLESTRGIPFAVRGFQPTGFASSGTAVAERHEIAIDMRGWLAAGSPTKLAIMTDHPSAERLFVLFKVAPQHLPGTSATSGPKPPSLPRAPSPPAAPTPPPAPSPPQSPPAPKAHAGEASGA